MKTYQTDCLILGAGASGLFCGAELAKGGKKVVILDKGKKIARKILMSGGGFCNFTNLDVTPNHYLCQNPHFVKSALSRFTPWDFITKVIEANIPYHEKEQGQLFCDNRAEDIVNLLTRDCQKFGVNIQLRTEVERVEALEKGFAVYANGDCWQTEKLIVATGGLSMPGLGVSPLGYQIAEQFGIPCIPPRASLVPFTWKEQDKIYMALAGVSLPVRVRAENGKDFVQSLLFTHRGISGPAILQISNYWQVNEKIEIDLLPYEELAEILQQQRQTSGKMQLKTLLSELLPSRLVGLWLEQNKFSNKTLAELTKAEISQLVELVHHWQLYPNGTEGYRTAEVTLGGVDTDYISSKTMEAKSVKGLYFIGEVLDVTGWLGGYNFQWAWSSAFAMASSVE